MKKTICIIVLIFSFILCGCVSKRNQEFHPNNATVTELKPTEIQIVGPVGLTEATEMEETQDETSMKETESKGFTLPKSTESRQKIDDENKLPDDRDDPIKTEQATVPKETESVKVTEEKEEPSELQKENILSTEQAFPEAPTSPTIENVLPRDD